MGSAWTVKLVGALPLPAEQLRAGIQSQFEAVNQALSTYRRRLRALDASTVTTAVSGRTSIPSSRW